MRALQSDGAELRDCRATAADVRFVKVDSDAAPVASDRCNIRSTPTLILFQRGIEVARASGAVPAAQLVSWVQQLLRPGAA